MSTHTADQDPIADSTLDALAAELAAMQLIAKALSSVRDHETRLRVLSWAHERFNAASALEQPPVSTVASMAADDDPLSVDSLQEFFEPSGRGESVAAQALAAHAWREEAPPAADPRPARDERPLRNLARGVANGLELLVTQWLTA
jgi:hypothetical protein